MAESTSPKKPAEEDGSSAGRARDQIIRLDSEREQRRAGTLIGNDELEAPVALEPAALEAPSKEPRQATVAVAPPAPVKPKRGRARPILF
ncbi:HlyD family secretion protein, partial [Mesorhizobium sp. M7A.F.Ca.CA.004.01.1.1]